ncbi:MAG TPA: hypothetical protein VGQ76_10375 [Thermoanaerobaculia bacterium]|jgi:hypothetical protein|nr:hypothetical protein [Thermoanaerobaculia bacterium]
MSARAIFPETVYRRRREPNQLPSDLKLIALEWALYFAVTGIHTAAELGRQLRAEAADRDDALRRLVLLGLIEEQALSAAEYVRALAAAGDREEKTLREFLIGASQPPVKLSVPRPPAPPLEFRRLPSPDDRKENRPMSHSRKLSLRALMNLIETQAGSREAGQIDIYRVFVRVDTTLLKRSGIETLRFTEDRFVSDPELEQAIVRSVKRTLGLECPETLWVDVA